MTFLKNNYSKGLTYAIIAGFMWAILSIAMKLALKFQDGLTLSWFRFSFSFLFLLIYLGFKEKNHLKVLRKPPFKAMLASLFLVGNYLFFIEGVKFTSPSLAQVLIQLAPIILVFIGVFYFKEKLLKRQIVGFLIALVGFFLFFEDQFKAILNADTSANFQWGALLIIIAAVSWALYGAFQKALLKNYSTNQINLLLYVFPSIILLPWVKWHLFLPMGFYEWSIVLFMGLNTVIAYGAISEAFKLLPTGQVSMIITLNPVLTIIIMSILDLLQVTWIETEKISLMGLLGAAFVVSGAMVVLYKKDKRSHETKN